MNLKEWGFQSLAGQVVLLTGASNGIGRAAAPLLARAGARLALTARREQALEQVAAEVERDTGQRPLTLAFDVADEQACQQAVETTQKELGRLDVLVNNAGVGIPTLDLSTADTAVWKQQMRTNVDGVFFLTRAALRVMKAQRCGHIVMVSSTAGINGNPVAPIYCTSKFALEGFTQGLHKQADAWRVDGIQIRVSNIKPGSVDSGYWGDRDVPRERFMTCAEMAAVYLWVLATLPTINVNEIRMETCRV